MIDAVIFDMDGLLIDSEPLWHIAEIEVFASRGLHLCVEDCLKTTGLRIDEVVRFWNQDPALAAQIVERVSMLIAERGEKKPGVQEAIAACGALPRALCSSSPRRLIDVVLAKLGLSFDVVHSAEHEPFGKPHPAVYLSTARLLGVEPAACIALEDSLNGVRSAKAAGMRCIAVPDGPSHAFVGVADDVVPSLTEAAARLSVSSR